MIKLKYIDGDGDGLLAANTVVNADDDRVVASITFIGGVDNIGEQSRSDFHARAD